MQSSHSVLTASRKQSQFCSRFFVVCTTGSLELASLLENVLVLAQGSLVMSLDVRSSGIKLISQCELPEQISAVDIHSCGSLRRTGDVVVVGQWVHNTIRLLSSPFLEAISETELGGYQPRSFRFLPISEQSACLVVGTSSGEAALVEVSEDNVENHVKFGEIRLVKIGSTGVRFENAEECTGNKGEPLVSGSSA